MATLRNPQASAKQRNTGGFSIDYAYINKISDRMNNTDINGIYNKLQTGQWADQKTYDDYIKKIEQYKSDYKILSQFTKDTDEDKNNFLSSLDSLSQVAKEQKDTFSKFKSQKEYDKAVSDLVKSDKERKEMASFNLDAGQKEIDELKKINGLSATYGVGYGHSSNPMYQDNPYAQNEDAINSLLSKYGYKDSTELNDAISKKEKYLYDAEQVQLTDKALNAPDFVEYAEKGASAKNPSYDDAMGGLSIGGWLTIGGKDIENKVAFVRDNYDSWLGSTAAHGNGASYYMAPGITAKEAERISEMQDDEIKTYNYYLAKEGKEKAQQYLDSMEEVLSRRIAEKTLKNVKGNAWLEIPYQFAAGIEGSFTGAKNLFSNKDHYIPYTPTQIASQAVSADLKDRSAVLGAMGDISSTIGRMLPSIAISLATQGAGVALGASAATATTIGNVLGNAAMGLSVAGDEYQAMLNSGMNKDQARAIGIAKGTWEAVSEYYLGGIPGLSSGKVSSALYGEALEKAGTGWMRGLLEFFGENAIERLGEGYQEVIQNIGSSIIDGVATGKWKFSSIEELAYEFTLGTLTSAVMNIPGDIAYGVDKVKTYSNYSNQYNDIKSQKELIAEGLGNDEETTSKKLAEKYQKRLDNGKKLSGRQIASVVEANRNASVAKDVSNIKSAVTDYLKDLGETRNIDTLASAIAKTVAGMELTSDENSSIESSKYANRVLNELTPENILSGKYSTALSEKINTKEINDYAYGKKGAESIELLKEIKSENENKTLSKQLPVSDTGNTVNSTTGEEISISGVESLKNGKMTLKLADGSTIDSKDVAFSNETEAAVYDYISDMDINTETANQFIKAYTNDIKPEVYKLGMNEGYQYGKVGYPMDAIKSSFFQLLHKNQQNTAYTMGVIFGDNQAQARQEEINKRVAAGKKKGIKRKGGIVFEGGESFSSLTDIQQKSVSVIGRIVSDITHNTVHLYASKENANGKRVFAYDVPGTEFKKGDLTPNGFYDENGDIWIDLNAGGKGEGTMLWTAAHEFTHFLHDNSPSDFKALSDFLMKKYGEKGVPVDELIQNEIDTLVNKEIAVAKAKNKTLTYEQAEQQLEDRLSKKGTSLFERAHEEVVARSMGKMLSDTDAFSVMEELKTENHRLWQKIKDFFAKWQKQIQKLYKKYKFSGDYANAYESIKDSIDDVMKLFSQGLVNAGENYQYIETESAQSETKYFNREDVLKSQNDIMAKFGITRLGDYVNVQKNVNKTLRKNGFFTNPDGISRTDVNEETGMVINTNQSGIKETFNGKNYAQNGKYLKLLKLLTIEKVPEVIRNGTVIAENQTNYHPGKNAKYAYIRGSVDIGGVSVSLKLAIRKSKNINKFWVHYVEIENSTNGTTSVGSKTDATAFNSIDAKHNVSTLTPNSQEKSSEKSELKYSYAGRTSRTARPSLLKKAQQMESEGKDSEDIRQETGWFRGYDGEWRYEIDDSKCSFIEKPNISPNEYYGEPGFLSSVSGILDHKDLFKAYPALKNIYVVIRTLNPNILGAYLKDLNLIEIDFERYTNLSKEYREYLDRYHRNDIKKIKQSPEYKDYKKIFVDHDYYNDMGYSDWREFINNVKNKFFSSEAGKLYTQLLCGDNEFNGNRIELKRSTNTMMTLIHELQHAIQAIEGFEGGSNEDDENYYRNAGEIEARDAMYRIYLTDEQRKYYLPDIDRTDVTFRESALSHSSENQSENSDNLNSAKDGDIRYSDRDDSESEKYWHTGMSSAEISNIIRVAKRQVNNSNNYIDDATKWLYTNYNGNQYFALYSTQDAEDPTILYASKGSKAEKEIKWLSDFVNEIKDGGNDYDATGESISTISWTYKDEYSKSIMDTGKSSDRQRNNTDVGVYRKNKNYRPDGALLNCLENIARNQEHNERHRGIDESKSNGTKFSERDENNPSNRMLLADALMTVAQNDIEKSKLQEYQNKVTQLNKWQNELVDINFQIKDLSFSKGKRDMAKISGLRDKATKLVNHINIADKQLLRLESTKALQNVLETEKKKAAKRATERQREIQQRRRESSNRTFIRNKIKRLYGKVERMWRNPTDSSYIPEPLRNAVLDVLASLDIRTGKTNKTQEALTKAYNEYQRLSESHDEDLKAAYDSDMAKNLFHLNDMLASRNIYDKDITSDMLDDIYTTLKSIYGQITDAKKLIGENEKMTIRESGNRIIDEQNEIFENRSYTGVKALLKAVDDKTSFFYLNSLRSILKMSNFKEDSELNRLFLALNDGLKKKYDFKMVVNKKLDALVKTKEGQKAFDSSVSDIIDFGWAKMTKMQAAQLMLTLERESNIGTKHIATGGATITDTKYRDNVEKRRDNATLIKHDTFQMMSDIQDVLSKDKWMQDYIEVAKEILRVDSKTALNETSQILKHRDLATDAFYIPFVTDNSFTVREIEGLVHDATIEGSGSLKSITKGAGNALYIEGLDIVLDRCIDTAADYYGLAVPIRNINRALNVKNDESGRSVKDSIKKNWKSDGLKLIEQTLTDIQTNRKNDRIAIIDTIKSAFITSTLNGNISVAIKQAASLDTAFAVLNYRPSAVAWAEFIKTVKNYNSIIDEIDEHTSEHWRRRIGLTTDEIATMKQNSGFFGKVSRKLPTAINGNKWIQMIDCWTTATFWNMAKQDIEKAIKNGKYQLEIGSDEYWNAVTDLYEETVEATQPMYDALHRSEMQKNAVSNKIFMFKTQPLQNAGMLYEAAHGLAVAKMSGDKALQKEKARKLGKVIYSQTRSAFTFALMTMIAAAIKGKMRRYKDEDDELTFASVAERIALDIGSTGTGLLLPIGGSEIYNYLESVVSGNGYEKALLSYPTADWINDYASSLTNVFKNPSAQNITRLLIKFGDITGQPATNYYNLIHGIGYNVKDVVNGDFLEFEASEEKTTSHLLKRAHGAYESGNNIEVKRYIQEIVDSKVAEGKTEKEAKGAIRSSLTSKYKPLLLEAYKNKDDEAMAEIRKFLNATGIYGSASEVVSTTQDWIRKSKE